MKTTTIDIRRLEELVTKEEAHDDYLRAIKKTREFASSLTDPAEYPPEGRDYIRGFNRGYLGALADIGRAIQEAAAARMGPM